MRHGEEETFVDRTLTREKLSRYYTNNAHESTDDYKRIT